MSKNIKKNILYISLLIIPAIVVLFVIDRKYIGKSIKIISNSNPIIFVLMLLIMFITFLIYGAIATILARFDNKDYRFYQGTVNGMIATYFNGITPSSTGGQVIQVYTFSQQGVSISSSASIMMMDFIIYQVSLVLFTLFTIIAKYNFIFNEVKWNGFNVFYLSILGFTINTSIIVGLYFLTYSKLIQRLVLVHFFNLLAKLKLLKNVEAKRVKISEHVIKFRAETTKLNQNIPIMLLILFLHLLKLFLMFTIPFFAFKSVGVNLAPEELYTIICMSSFIYLITSFFPLPGASGGAELMFTIFFSAIYIDKYAITNIETVAAVMLLWRFVTFYFGMITGGVVSVFYRSKGKERRKQKNEEDKNSLIAEDHLEI